jgi:hypothetical protein
VPVPPRLTDHYLNALEEDVRALKEATADLPAIRTDLDLVKGRPRTALTWAKDGLQAVTFLAAVAAILQRSLAPAPAAAPQTDPEAIARRAAEVAVEAMARQQSPPPGSVKPAKFTTP